MSDYCYCTLFVNRMEKYPVCVPVFRRKTKEPWFYRSGSGSLGLRNASLIDSISHSLLVSRRPDRIISENILNILINNAGNSSMVAIAEMDEVTWDEVLDTHLKGTYVCSHFVLPHMVEQHSGNIVSISSVGGQRGFGMEGDDAKEQFTAGHLIKDPSVESEDIGRAVLWLVSDDARCITGNMITVDGGWTAAAP